MVFEQSGWRIRRPPVHDASLALLCALVFAVWLAITAHNTAGAASAHRGGTWHLQVVLFCVIFCQLCLSCGSRLLQLICGTQETGGALSFPLRFVLGVNLIGVALLLVVWFVPLRLSWSLPPLLILLAAFGYLARGTNGYAELENASERERVECGRTPMILAVALSLAAATLWSQDSIRPEIHQGDAVIYKPWVDSFEHAILIATLGKPQLPRVEPGMGGTETTPYHIAPFLVPAALTAFTGVSAYQSCAGLLVPFGLFLMGLAAFLLVQSFWREREAQSGWAGLAAVAVVFLPSAPYHGARLMFFDYHWLLSISSGGAYCIAVLAAAWALMFRACTLGSYRILFFSYALLAWSVMNKAQVFVAASFLLWIWPAFFMAGWSWRRRLAAGVFFVAIFSGAIRLSARFTFVPTLSLDDSATKQYMISLRQIIGNDTLREYFDRFSTNSTWWHDARWGAVMLIACTFGLLAPLCAIFFVALRKRLPLPALLFPFAVIASYLYMALRLAFNTNTAWTREELLHRPFVWAYFAGAAWLGGALYWTFFRMKPLRASVWRGVLLALLLIAPLGFGAWLGRGLLDGPSWGFTRRGIPAGLVDCCEYLRRTAAPADLVQDYRNDSQRFIQALSERRAYFFHLYTQGELPPPLAQREASLKHWWDSPTGPEVFDFASENKIRWAILQPGDVLAWPAAFVTKPEFESLGFRVYRLP